MIWCDEYCVTFRVFWSYDYNHATPIIYFRWSFHLLNRPYDMMWWIILGIYIVNTLTPDSALKALILDGAYMSLKHSKHSKSFIKKNVIEKSSAKLESFRLGLCVLIICFRFHNIAWACVLSEIMLINSVLVWIKQVKDCGHSSALAKELPQSWTYPSVLCITNE